MVVADGSIKLPDYHAFSNAISDLNLPISCAELHGVICGYLAAGGGGESETYLRALLAHRKAADTREAALALFDLLTISQQQMADLGFEFELLLPADEETLAVRAQAFSEWCEGFTQGLTIVGLDFNALQTEEAQDAVQHLTEFAQLDYEALRVNEEDERALMEVVEYTRMAVLSIHAEVHPQGDSAGRSH